MAKAAASETEIRSGVLTRAASFNPSSVNADGLTADLVWTTGAIVQRWDCDGNPYQEQLSLDPGAVDLSRLNAGAPLLNSHSSYTLTDILGVVTAASIEGGEGVATVRFSSRADVAPIFADVVDGVIRNVSVGYSVSAWRQINQAGQPPLMIATRWQPLEISLVPIPADAGAQVRSGVSLKDYGMTVDGTRDGDVNVAVTIVAPPAADADDLAGAAVDAVNAASRDDGDAGGDDGSDGEMAADLPADMTMSRSDALEIVRACGRAGVPAMAERFLEGRLTLAQVTERLSAAPQIRAAVETAARYTRSVAADAADGFIAEGLSLSEVRSRLFEALAASNVRLSSAVPMPGAADATPRLDIAAIYAARNAPKTPAKAGPKA
ncbi:MAG TPA: hypothetical protein VKT80_09105 [Chloroflexota bacterium]|nr:hypothetical protein [Chloroflexota bacterium]